MERGNLSRRGFLERSLTTLTMGVGLPVWFAKEQIALAEEEQAARNRPVAANDRLKIGFIGTGSRARQLRGNLLRNHRRAVEIVAACDVDERHIASFIGNPRDRIHLRNCARFDDYRQLLNRRDIDIAFVVTPDHWHALPVEAAMRAGKDVYCEKPLTLTLAEGKHLVQVAQSTNKILQTGSQQRTEYQGRFRLACELIRNGRIGPVQTVKTVIGTNPIGGPFPVARAPRQLNWLFWQGPAPRQPYVEKRCHYQFRWWYEYSGGKMTDWGAHHNDIAQWALNMDNSGPVRVEPIAARIVQPSNRAHSYNCHPRFEVRYTYANGPRNTNGTVVRCMSNDPDGKVDNGVLFEGTNGRWLFVNRSGRNSTRPRYNGLVASAPAILADLPATATRLPRAANHIADFLDCVRRRRQPICKVTVGHRSVSVCHIGNIAIRTGQTLRWDPRTEQFVGNAAANRMLNRTMTAPWRLTPVRAGS